MSLAGVACLFAPSSLPLYIACIRDSPTNLTFYSTILSYDCATLDKMLTFSEINLKPNVTLASDNLALNISLLRSYLAGSLTSIVSTPCISRGNGQVLPICQVRWYKYLCPNIQASSIYYKLFKYRISLAMKY
jgi:hypothetical protein